MTVNELNAQLSDILVLLGSIREQLDGSEPSTSAAAAAAPLMDMEPVEVARGKEKSSRRLPAGFWRGATIDGNCFFFKTNSNVYSRTEHLFAPSWFSSY